MRGKLYSSSAKLEILCKSLTYGTRLVWNSFRSTLREPSKRSDAVIDDTTWAIRRFKFVKLGDGIPRFFLQIS